MRTLFAFDISPDAVACGLLETACAAVREVLFSGEMESSTVAFMTFDGTVHFYDLSVSLVISHLLQGLNLIAGRQRSCIYACRF